MAAYLAAVNALAVARQHLGSLDKVTRIVRLGVLVATSGDVRDSRKSLTALQSCCRTFSEKTKTLATGVRRSQPSLGVPVELELIFEVSA
jgi:hypothetical protein